MKATRPQLAAQINRALHSVRADLDTCIEQYRLRMTAGLAHAIRNLEGSESDDTQAMVPAHATLKALAACVVDIKLKPHKGRGKDLRRIDHLVTTLLDQLNPGK